jgi:hypothetical protein
MADAEAPATSATLYAVHQHVATRCGDVSAAFLACKAGDQNPEVCLKQGAAVTTCVVGLCAPRRLPHAPPRFSRPRVPRRGVRAAAAAARRPLPLRCPAAQHPPLRAAAGARRGSARLRRCTRLRIVRAAD